MPTLGRISRSSSISWRAFNAAAPSTICCFSLSVREALILARRSFSACSFCWPKPVSGLNTNLVRCWLFNSRSRARDLINSGSVICCCSRSRTGSRLSRDTGSPRCVALVSTEAKASKAQKSTAATSKDAKVRAVPITDENIAIYG